jgi:hypothetical protein
LRPRVLSAAWHGFIDRAIRFRDQLSSLAAQLQHQVQRLLVFGSIEMNAG